MSIAWIHPLALALLLATPVVQAAEGSLAVSVYATAGDVQHYLATPEGRERALPILKRLTVSRLWLEGRRGDEYVSPSTLGEARGFFAAQGIRCSGGIATVPGASFGTRQQGGLGWLNWESTKTRQDVAGFFRENAPVFDTLIVDDFYCTGDESPGSVDARGDRSWGAYRRDLLVSLLEPLIFQPARKARPDGGLILKFPQWYDRFHLFGYDPERMSTPFDQIWVGTEVRDPQTRRMGFVQPTEGYVNFRWLASVAGDKVRGAWFDHIECGAHHFVDQACLSVLAGAQELTLFHLGDLLEGHPGDVLLAERLPELRELAGRMQGRGLDGVAFFKPPGGEPFDNLYLMDYLAMIGLPIVPVARYPAEARVLFLGAQAAAEPTLLSRMRRHLDRGATLVLTPALIRAAGGDTARLAGIEVGAVAAPTAALQVKLGSRTIDLPSPLEIDLALALRGARTRIGTARPGPTVPLLTSRRVGRGTVLVLNVRTFSEQDFLDAGEWLLAPKPRGLSAIPEVLANAVREVLLEPLAVQLRAPTGVTLHLFDGASCLYNFHDDPVRVHLNGKPADIPAHRWLWRSTRGRPGAVEP